MRQEVDMRIFFTIMIGCFLLLCLGCTEKATSPDLLLASAPSPQPVPNDVQKILESYLPTGNDADPSAIGANADIPANLAGDYDLYAVTILWGALLSTSPAAGDSINWSGRLWVNAEATIDVRQVIDFETGKDSLVPVNMPAMVAWVSQTAADFDGISVLIHLKRDILYFMAPMLTFETPPLTLSLGMHQLDQFAAYYPIDTINGVAILARRLWPNDCPGGTIKGRWVKSENSGQEGRFDGIWFDRLGEPMALMVGTYWTAEDGAGRFSGWLTGVVTDQIIAWLDGTWWYDDYRLCPLCGEGHGQFRGVFKYANDSGGGGFFRGEFGDFSLPFDQRELPLLGMWQKHCVYAYAAPVPFAQ